MSSLSTRAQPLAQQRVRQAQLCDQLRVAGQLFEVIAHRLIQALTRGRGGAHAKLAGP
jgi:hypothetical protein